MSLMYLLGRTRLEACFSYHVATLRRRGDSLETAGTAGERGRERQPEARHTSSGGAFRIDGDPLELGKMSIF